MQYTRESCLRRSKEPSSKVDQKKCEDVEMVRGPAFSSAGIDGLLVQSVYDVTTSCASSLLNALLVIVDLLS
jgi:hypothetical protein